MTVVIIQCRLSSTRLANKAMMSIGKKPLVWWTMRAMKKVSAARYVLATDEASLEALSPIAAEAGYEIIAGPLEDVLERFCIVIRETNADTVLRATADNPYLFYEAAISLLDEYNRRGNIDYITYTGLPHGSGVEVMNAAALLKAGEEASAFDREHVGPSLYNHKDKFNCVEMNAPSRFNHPSLRTTVDTMADLRRARLLERVVYKMRRDAGEEDDTAYTTEEIINALNTPCVKHPILFVPSTIAGQGTAHLRRCREAAEKAGGFLFIPDSKGEGDISALLSIDIIDGIIHSGEEDSNFAPWQVVHTMPEKGDYALIVCDSFMLDKDEAKYFSDCAPLLSIDDGGKDTSLCDCLIDIIPSILHRKANIEDPALMAMPIRVRTEEKAKSIEDFNKESVKVLVCFGGEDPANLTCKTAEAIKEALPNAEVFAIVNGAEKEAGEKLDKAGIKTMPPLPLLREKLADYSLVVTHYGLTAYEAKAAGCAVLLCNTTPLHGALSRKYGFTSLDKNNIKAEKVIALLSAPSALYPASSTVLPSLDKDYSLPSILQQAASGRRLNCPVCGKDLRGEVVSRSSRQTYRRCPNCHIVYMSWTMDSAFSSAYYGANYFNKQYKEQYGKTYLEDFDAIKAQGVRRIKEIDKLCRSARRGGGRAGEDKERDKRGSILDIGCAYGPFLKAAQEDKWQVFGTDVSDEAVSYVHSTLLLPAAVSLFPDFDAAREFGISAFDAVSMWYVIEHFQDLNSVLSLVSSLVKKGGVFAFSTPSGEGVSAKMQKDKFFEESPADHYTIWEPSRAEKILSKYGFKVEKTISTGHHAERFPDKLRLAGSKGEGFGEKAVLAASHLFKLGDTCEVYCRKV